MSGDGPAISIIIAAYNWSSALDLAIQSVLMQTHTDFELLVIGDHCTDDIETVVARFGDPRIHWRRTSARERRRRSRLRPSIRKVAFPRFPRSPRQRAFGSS